MRSEYMSQKVRSAWLGISIGAPVSILFGVVYLVVLHEPGSAFYLFTGLVFLAGPLIGGVVTMLKTREHRRKAFFTSGSIVFGIVWMLFILTYLVFPLFDRAGVKLPEVCDRNSGSFDPPASLAYTLPDEQTGVLLTEDAQSALVAVIDYNHPPFPSTVFLVDKSDDHISRSLSFENDVITAAIDGDTLYLYNDKIGYFIDARTGELENDFLTIDNYGGLSQSENPIISSPASSGDRYLETSAVITSWRVDGSVKSRRHLTFNGIALGCFVYGDAQNVAVLK
jgi:hypothetical protein